jgi:YVTN family beta-propeller protein
VSVDKTNNVAVLDWKKNEIVKNIDVGSIQHGVNLSPDGKFVWVANIGAKEVPVIDVNTLQIVKKVPVDGNPIHIVFSPDSKYPYVTATGNLIYKFNTSTYQQVWKTTGTTVPAHCGVSPDGKELWTLNHGMDPNRYPYMLGGLAVEGIQIFDTDNGKLLNEIPAEAMPHEIQFVPYSAFGLPPKADQQSGGTVGKDLYEKNCASCHGVSGEGDMGPKLATSEWSDASKVAQIVKAGKGSGMPAYKDKLKDEEIQSISQYVASLKK